MVALGILVPSVQVRILVSQPESRNPLFPSGFCIQDDIAGTQPGQSDNMNISLHETILELCKEKKMRFFKPVPYVHYVPAKLHSAGKVWYISFYVTDPATGKLKRQRIKINHIPLKARRKAAKEIIANINERLVLGWNPLDKCTASKGVKAFEAMDLFLKAKTKESEDSTIRTYRSQVKLMKKWLLDNGFNADSYAAAFTKEMAMSFMDDVDNDENQSAQTYNNKVRFYSVMCNWMVEKGYISSNPFASIKRKSKRLTKKTRRTFTAEELETLWTVLERENKGYLLICLFCYCCFMRPKEIVMLKCGDIDPERQIVNVRGEVAKNDNDSQRTIPDSMLKYLSDVDLSHPDWYLFSGAKYEFRPGPTKIWSQRISDYWFETVRASCGFGNDLQFYSLKDTGITNMLGKGVPVSYVRQQADHSSLSMTSVYVGKSARANEDLKKIDILH